MKFSQTRLRQLIREALLLELFESDPYSFRFMGAQIDNPGVPFAVLSYAFKTDSYEQYMVSVNNAAKVTELVVDEETGEKVEKEHHPWDVMFRLVDGSYDELTGAFDMKVYGTVIAIVRDFVENRLPYLKNESARSQRSFKITPVSGFEGDARRARVYQRILKNYGIDAEIKEDGPEHFSLSFVV